jgi:single-strand selective monofunctional uracil DNA glycosylase
VKGFSIERSEISGKRLWSLMQKRFGSAKQFFSQHAVMNYCPLVFMDSGKTGRNVVPEKLSKEERTALTACCNAYLDDIVSLMEPQSLVGIGQFAKKQLQGSAQRLHLDLPVMAILHPSPGNPQANSGWEQKVTHQLEEARLW